MKRRLFGLAVLVALCATGIGIPSAVATPVAGNDELYIGTASASSVGDFSINAVLLATKDIASDGGIGMKSTFDTGQEYICTESQPGDFVQRVWAIIVVDSKHDTVKIMAIIDARENCAIGDNQTGPRTSEVVRTYETGLHGLTALS